MCPIPPKPRIGASQHRKITGQESKIPTKLEDTEGRTKTATDKSPGKSRLSERLKLCDPKILLDVKKKKSKRRKSDVFDVRFY